MPTYWSPTAPGVQKPGGASWFALQVTNIAMKLKALSSSLSGTYMNSGTLTGLLPQKLSAAMSGLMQPHGSMAGLGQPLSASFAGNQADFASMGVSLPSALSASLNGTDIITQGQIATALQGLEVSAFGIPTEIGSISAVLQATRVAMAAQSVNQGAAFGLLQKTSVALAGAQQQSGNLSGALQRALGAIAGTSVGTGITFDALGSGIMITAGTVSSGTHNATDGAYVLAFVDCAYPSGGAPLTSSVTYGGTPMVQLGIAYDDTATYGVFQVFGLAGVAGGSKSVVVTPIAGYYGGIAQTVSYVNAVAASTVAATAASYGPTLSLGPVTLAANRLVVQGFGTSGALGTPALLSSLSGGTNRYNAVRSDNQSALSISDSATSGTTFTASNGASVAWGGLGVTLLAMLPATPTFTVGAIGTTTAVIPAHAVGDLIVIVSANASGTAVAVPAASGTVPAWAQIDFVSGPPSMVSAQFTATATNHTSGTWTNANDTVAIVIKGAAGIGGHAMQANASATSTAVPALTLSNTDNTSVLFSVALCATGFFTSGSGATATTGYTRRSSVTSMFVNTKDSTTSDGAYTQALGASLSAVSMATQIEIRAY